ncbi:MAG TPA: glycosyltransferase [Acidiphilium sp.]
MLAAREARGFAITFLLDPALPPPAPDLVTPGETATSVAYGFRRSGGIFLQPAPMSFPPGPVAALLRAPRVRSVAVVLDFIPHDFPDLYLRDPASRRADAAGLAALRRHDRFLPISAATEARLHALIPSSIGRSTVTGVAIRDGLIRTAPPPDFAGRDGVVVVAGDDPRKNPEVVMRAGIGAPIRVFGVHDPATRNRLAALHAGAGGAPEALGFMSHLDDAGLAEACARARLVIAPSRAEGFSLPVIEAMAQGTPVLAADEPAQAELVADPSDRFAPDDAATLGRRARALLADPEEWARAQVRQSGVWHRFTAEAVAARFWAPIGALADDFAKVGAPAVLRGAKPRIAFLSPLPPARSGCADHSAALLAELAPRADVSAFSDTENPVLPAGIDFGGRADATTMRSPRFDAIVAVLGNSPFHRTETRLLLEHGAAAILHDARLIDLYRTCYGDGRARGVASAELGRAVTQAEIEAWTRDQAGMAARFLGEVAEASSPLIVHAADTARFIAARHGVDAVHLPFPPYRLPDPASLTPEGRAAARVRLGVAPDGRLIASFGHVHGDKAPDDIIAAFARLGPRFGARRNFRFALVGSGNPVLVEALRGRAEALGIPADALILGADQVPETVYRDFLAAADVAVQLRRAPPGSISGALMDAVAAGIPSVASATLAEALEPPDYVTAVDDDAGAETIAAAIGAALERDRCETEALRTEFLDRRGMGRYAARLVEAMTG